MENIFYNSFSILLGILLLVFSILTIKNKKKVLFGIIAIIISVLYVTLGIGGFFLPKEYEFITVLGMLALCIIMLICLLTLYKKDKTDK